MRMHMRSVASAALAATLSIVFLLGSPSQAAVVYDESGSGDMGVLASPAVIGALNLGTNSVLGSLPGSSAGDTADWLSFVISPGTEVTSFVLANWVNDPSFPTATLPIFLPNPSTATFVNDTFIGVDLLPTLIGGPLGAGTHLFGVTTGSINISAYQVDFTVAPVAAIPLPAALPLFLTALVGLGLVARRRRQEAVA